MKLSKYNLTSVKFDKSVVDSVTLAELVENEYGAGVLVGDGIVIFSSDDYNHDEVEADIAVMIDDMMND